ncbi:hypothetical protein P170DRAFT_439675 [Aspergillus steynii IBT 23096]|uniref:Uncharacterized protein n=1 Tax=Aspergillus steynii IBT 23096 TaxID=1392250 RepID=A0A2I2FZB9_9EURO|nr:uncharacterized protein P170DRAFT_439675 [Aspergillus steynii IBT 23096]PLB45974.1 hypothetical protein P170DRAFT_439675 [Aspergillus steynii IBT 23096]
MTSYLTYRVAESGLPRDHQLLFVETHESGPHSGHKYHVIGNIQEGMTFNHRAAGPPEEEPVFFTKQLLGRVAVADYPRFLAVCETVPVPKKQFQGAKRLYPSEPLRRCGEWADEATKKLLEEGVIVQGSEN